MRKRPLAGVGGVVLVALLCLMGNGPPAALAAGQVVVCNWGGNSATFEKECFYDSFEKETGIKVVMTSPPDTAKIKAQVDSGNIEWDVILTDLPAILTLTEEGKTYLEELDYSKIDPKVLAQVIPEVKLKYSLGARVYSFNIAYNTRTFKPGNHPKSWADVWDVRSFPGSGASTTHTGGSPPSMKCFSWPTASRPRRSTPSTWSGRGRASAS
jgi:putative spermidine/putrescine transport system substrate-binding protein